MKLEIISQKPATMSHATPLLLVHGAWHGAWCWEYFMPYFAERGYEVHAISLRGHGQSEGHEKLRWHSIANYVEDVAQVVQGLSQPPVLIGHSMGGMVVQKYLEQATTPAGVLLASIPPAGILGFALRLAARRPLAFLKSQLLLTPWYAIETPQLMTEAFFSPNLPPARIAEWFGKMQGESFRMELDAMLLNLPRPTAVKTPLLVMGGATDKTFTVAEVEATAKAYGTTAVIFPNMAHDMMLEPGWQDVAQAIDQWLIQRGL